MNASEIRLIDNFLLDDVIAQARVSPRKRKNRNLHSRDNAPAQRLLNAIEPGSYVAPHRHLNHEKDETFIVLRGKFGLVIFDNGGNVAQTQVIEAGGIVCGVDIPHSTWHSVVSLKPDSIFFEAKAGPYLPFTADEKAPWAPLEGDAGAAEYLSQLERLFA